MLFPIYSFSVVITHKMSGLTDEWQLSTIENRTKYMIEIEKFDKKIKFLCSGRKISSKNIRIGQSSLSVNIYPGGISTRYRKYVSLFLDNTSEWSVKARAKISIASTGFSRQLAKDEYFHPINTDKSSSWGFHCFVSHDRCK